MKALIQSLIKKLKNGGRDCILYKMILGALIPIFVLSLTYSGVFFVKGDLLWSLIYTGIMASSGGCLVWMMLFKTNEDREKEE